MRSCYSRCASRRSVEDKLSLQSAVSLKFARVLHDNETSTLLCLFAVFQAPENDCRLQL